MALTAATFKARFSEFTNVPDARVTAELAAATTRTHADFGDDFDEAVALRAAHMLKMSAYGQRSQDEQDAMTTAYWSEWQRLARARFGGPRLASSE